MRTSTHVNQTPGPWFPELSVAQKWVPEFLRSRPAERRSEETVSWRLQSSDGVWLPRPPRLFAGGVCVCKIEGSPGPCGLEHSDQDSGRPSSLLTRWLPCH